MTVRLGEEGLGRKLDRATELAGDCGPAGETAAPELSLVRVWHPIGTSVRGVHTRRHCSIDVWPHNIQTNYTRRDVQAHHIHMPMPGTNRTPCNV